MEKEYYTTDFEQLLKDATEDFKMYPSRRVWNSLYNNLHPAKRWPSLAVCLLLVTSILYIGVTNNNAINASSKFASSTRIWIADNHLNSSTKDLGNEQVTEAVVDKTVAVKNKSLNNYEKFLAEQDRVKQLLSLNIRQENVNAYVDSKLPYNSQKESAAQSSVITISNVSEANIQNPTSATSSTNSKTIEEKFAINDLPIDNPKEITSDNRILETSANIKNKLTQSITESLNNPDKAWIDNYAFYNRNEKNKWKAKTSLEYYITPSIGFRDIGDNSTYKPGVNNSLVASTANGNLSKDVDQQAAVNLEAGAALLYSVSKKLRLKAGLQFNYTNYSINAYELKHPAQTSLLLNDPITGNRPRVQAYNTLYANSPALSSTKLNNNTVQLSVPLGFDYKIAGNNRIQWYAGATAQPTYVASGNAYLVSADMKFYVNDNSFIRHWNMNSAVETFISYKTNNGLIINAGPQIRYQLFSTYTKEYTYTEKLYNIGLKMGITRNF
ncbi:MAG: hypothetical protein ABIW38_09570 [Ferruginibacter sp.]